MVISKMGKIKHKFELFSGIFTDLNHGETNCIQQERNRKLNIMKECEQKE